MPLPRNALQNDIWLLAGNSTSADQAAAGKCVPIFTNFLLVHGLLMFFGWGVCLVWGTFIARYFSSSGTTWFLLHRILQVSQCKQCIITMYKTGSGKELMQFLSLVVNIIQKSWYISWCPCPLLDHDASVRCFVGLWFGPKLHWVRLGDSLCPVRPF